VETSSARGFQPSPIPMSASVISGPARRLKDGNAYLDLRCPVVSPSLWQKAPRVESSPFQMCRRSNAAWATGDWELCCESFDISPTTLCLAHAFDTDDAALHACVAGLGMLLAPTILTGSETRSSALVPPDTSQSRQKPTAIIAAPIRELYASSAAGWIAKCGTMSDGGTSLYLSLAIILRTWFTKVPPDRSLEHPGDRNSRQRILYRADSPSSVRLVH